MAPRVYVETTVISYLTARLSRNVVYRGHQHITREWWDDRRQNFEVFVSAVVIEEASRGDAAAARRRLDAIAEIPLLKATENAFKLANRLLAAGSLPQNAGNDALHAAIAAIERMDYLLTWNCRHLANAKMRPKIEAVCREFGHHAPVICTPDQLMEA